MGLLGKPTILGNPHIYAITYDPGFRDAVASSQHMTALE